MDSALKRNIKTQLERNRLSISELERRAGLKPSAVRNILDGRSKKPNIEMLRAIAKQFDQGVDALISEEEDALTGTNESSKSKYGFDTILYHDVFHELTRMIGENNIKVTIDEFQSYAKQVYDYCIESELTFIDKRFVKYTLREKIKNREPESIE